MSQESLRDSTVISRTIRLINDYKACEVYTGQLEQSIEAYRRVNNLLREERDGFLSLLSDCELVIEDYKKDLVATEERLARSERRRKIGRYLYSGIGATAATLIVLTIKK